MIIPPDVREAVTIVDCIQRVIALIDIFPKSRAQARELLLIDNTNEGKLALEFFDRFVEMSDE
jgi:hypothetical protein